jgi:uncharacterized membrane protein
MIAGRAIALPVHLVGALIALPLGAFVLWRPKGTPAHKALGRMWVAVMMVVAISSYWLRTLSGGFSFIHFAVGADHRGAAAGHHAGAQGQHPCAPAGDARRLYRAGGGGAVRAGAATHAGRDLVGG